MPCYISLSLGRIVARFLRGLAVTPIILSNAATSCCYNATTKMFLKYTSKERC